MTLGAFTVTDTYYLLVAAMIFTIGGVGVLVRRNVIVMFMCVELMLNAVNLTFVSFAHALNDITGQVIVFFTLVVAAVQVIVYASAIVVLFLFVIMLLGVDRKESLEDRIPGQRAAAIVLGLVLLAEIVFLAGHEWATGQETASGVPLQGGGFGGNVERVARVLFTDFLWAFEITAVLLVIAVVGAVVLARRSGQRPDRVPQDADAGDEVTA